MGNEQFYQKFEFFFVENGFLLTKKFVGCSQRNRLMRITLIITLASLSISIGAFGAGIFGMNLLNGWETTEHTFSKVTATLLGTSLATFVSMFLYYRRTKYGSSFSRLSRSVSELRNNQDRLFVQSERAKLLYNYSNPQIFDKQSYDKFLKNNQLDLLSNFYQK
jgi:hypothetical protein